MATKEIGLKLKISSSGEEKVIKNLSELEQELGRLQSELKTLDFGSEAFVQASKNIQTLKTRIDDVEKTTEGLGAEKRFRALGDAVNVVVGSFQVLSGIIGLVISDSEDLEAIQKAETFALGVLNVALGINAINTALVESATTRAALAQRLNTIATKAATIAQAAFNAVLSANPVLVVVAGITALTAALAIFIKASRNSTEAEEDANAVLEEQQKLLGELNIARIEATADAQVQYRILTDNVRARNLELSVIEELKKEYPGFNAFLNKNNELTADGNRFLELNIKLLGIKASLDTLYKKRTELNVQSNEALNRVAENQNSIIGRLTNAFKFGLNPAAQFYGAVAEFQPTIKAVNSEIVKQEAELNNLQGTLKPLQDQLEKQAKAESELGKQTKETTKTFDVATAKILERIGVLDILIKKLGEAQGAELTFLDGVSQKQQEIIQQQEDFFSTQTEALQTQGEAVAKTLEDLFFKAIPSPDDFAQSTGVVFTIFDQIVKRLDDPNLDLSKAVGFDKFLSDFVDGDETLKKFVETIPESTKVSLNEFFNSYRDRVVGLQTQFTEIGGKTITFLAKPQKEIFELLRKLETEQSLLFKNRLAEGKTEKQIYEEGRNLIEKQLLGTEGLTQARKDLEAATKKYNDAVKTGNVDEIETAAQVLKGKQDIVLKYKELADQILEGVVRNNKFVESIQEGRKEFEKAATTIDTNATKIQQGLDPEKVKEYFKKNAEDYVFILRDISTKNQKYLQRFGEEGIQSILAGINLGLQELDGKSREELQALQTNLQTLGDELKMDFNLKDNPFLKLLEEISKRLKELPTEAEENFEKTLANVANVVEKFTQIFSDLLGRVQGIFAAQTSLYLEQLAYSEEQALATIGNATERERKEQAKVQKEFAQKRFELEKKARIQELQFTIANTIASGAQAFVQALGLKAPPPIPQLYAAAVAGLTIAQVAVIRDQLQFTQSKQFIGRRGGLIQGATHEGGGVPAMLEGGEFVVNKEGVRQFGDVISSINTATGGRSLSIDDSRIVQAIASQNSNTKQPLKAYVLYDDIQSTNKLNQKITSLARL